MSGLTEHYDDLLADHYSWLFGGLGPKIEENKKFFQANDIVPSGNRVAIDLGCGSGFQSIPLAQIGFNVIAVDVSSKLLSELNLHKSDLNIKTIQGDILQLPRFFSGQAALCVCMGDTLTHIESLDKMEELFRQVWKQLEKGGKFILTFRDLSFEVKELDRFIPVRSEPAKTFTCFLEYEPTHVKVHDLIYERSRDEWHLKKGFYRKCRVPFDWAKKALMKTGFHLHFASLEKGFITIIALKE